MSLACRAIWAGRLALSLAQAFPQPLIASRLKGLLALKSTLVVGYPAVELAMADRQLRSGMLECLILVALGPRLNGLLCASIF